MNRWWFILIWCSCLIKAKSQEIIIQPPVFMDFGCTEFFKLYTGSVNNFSSSSFITDLVIEVDYTNPSGRTVRLADGILSDASGVEFIPGLTVVNSASYEQLYKIRQITFYDKDIEDLLSRTKCLPPGTYDVCLTLFDHNDPGRQNPLTQTCYTRDKEVLGPLLLVSPFEGEEVIIDLPLFTWTAVTPVNPRAMYRLQMVEVLADQTPFEALRSNPLFFEEIGLRSNIFQYPVSARPLAPCMTYAWRITYELEGRFTGTAFQRNPDFLRQSEIWMFRTGCDKEEEEEKELVEDLEKYYLEPSLSTASQFYEQKGQVMRVALDNPYEAREKLNIEILGPDEIQVYSLCCPELEWSDDESKIPGKDRPYLISGMNYLRLNLESFGLKDGQFYTMRFVDFKQPLYLNFKYEASEQ